MSVIIYLISNLITSFFFFFFFNDTATTEIYTLSLHDALPISGTELFSKAFMPQSVGRRQAGGRKSRPEPLRCALHPLDDDVLDLAGAVAAKRGGSRVFGRVEAGDRPIEARELDHDEAMKLLRPFHDAELAPARENLAAVAGNDVGHEIRVLLVFDRIDDARPRDPIGRHEGPPFAMLPRLPIHWRDRRA